MDGCKPPENLNVRLASHLTNADSIYQQNRSEGESGTDEIWRASASPVESFSDAEGANEDGEWPVEVIGEEVDGSGKIRCERTG